MPAKKKYALLYCQENQEMAKKLEDALSKQGHAIKLYSRNDDAIHETLKDLDIDQQAGIIMLITDNYLKSAGCMNGALPAARLWSESERLVPVVSDGTGPGTEQIATHFDKVSDIIQYMNYWQDKYLAYRKEKRQQPAEEGLEHRIRVTKRISADVGEFLRFLRGTDWIPLAEFLPELRQEGTAPPEAEEDRPVRPESGAVSDPSQTDEKVNDEESLVAYIKDSGDEIMAENTELDNPYTIESMEGEVDEDMLSEIPGMDQLKDREDKSKSTVNLDELIEEEPEEKSSKQKGKRKKKRKKGKTTETSIGDEEEAEENAIINEVLTNEQFEQGDPNATADEQEEYDLESLFDEEQETAESTAPLTTGNTRDSSEGDHVANPSNGVHASPQKVLEKAIALFKQDLKEEGVSYLKEAADRHPEDAALHYFYAYALARYVHDFDKANDQLDQLLDKESAHTDAWFLKAEIAESRQDYDAARAGFERVAMISPEYPEVYYRLGLLTAQHFEGEEQTAATYFRRAGEKRADHPDAHYMLANLLHERLGDTEDAVHHFKKTLQIQPSHPFASYDLALIYHKQGEKNLAAQYYQHAIAVNPELQTDQNDAAFGLATGIVEPAAGEDKATSGTSETEPETEKSIASEETDMKNTNLKTVLITGATAGIGEATARLFAQNGYRVIATGRRRERLEALQQEFADSFQNEIQVLPFDVRNPGEVESALNNLPEEWRSVDILINNAGLSRGLGPIHEGRLEDWDTMIDTNIKGLLYLTRAISPQMVERRSGHIINIASNAGKEVYPGGNVYCATKAAVDALTKAMRLDLYEHNVRVSQVAPGHVEETEFARVRFDGDAERAAKVYDNFQPLKSSDVAEAVYFIATRPAYVNIQDITMFGTQQAGSNFISRSGRPGDDD